MLKDILRDIRIGGMITLVLAVLLCGAYPMLVWGIAQGLFPRQAEGTLLHSRHAVIGSRLIAQAFTGEAYFHPRPSAAGYDALHSGGSNLGPLSRQLQAVVKQRVAAYRTENRLPDGILVPGDAVTASGSGLDPHIGRANALLQLPRVARARGMGPDELQRIIDRHTEPPDLGFLGEARVNVLDLNLDLDGRAVYE